jgi:hypothetical protein
MLTPPEYKPPEIPGCLVSDEATVVRFTVVGPIEESKVVVTRLYEDPRVRITRQGPYTDKELWPICDTSRFLLRVEVTL